ncbi:MAG: hypothetical protein ACYC6A_06315 [Armatimonadota bacterium]
MNTNYTAPWHRASFDTFVHERLPELLATHGPLIGYHAEAGDGNTCRLTITLSANGAGDIALTFTVPQPDADGLFTLDGQPHVVVPLASTEDLEYAEIRCAGEQLYDYLAERLTEAPPNMLRDESVARAWLPLDVWWGDFLASNAQRLDTTNWLSERTHLRRLAIPRREKVITPGQFGRVDPFETPEGPNIGHILSIATGAEIRDGKLIITDPSPQGALGIVASCVPLLEHNDANRQLMGLNMMRQWIRPTQPEPALVQTGNEPAAPGFWCGFNLLTAFVSWGADTYEDGLLMSESCAKRLRYPAPVEPGDKFSNRHGTKGVISRILPDAEMPHLADGTPVDLVYSFLSIHTRMTFGQVREAMLGRIARAANAPVVAPPFHAPGEEELHRRLAEAGLPEDGMEQLYDHGQPLDRRSLVGWVYWGLTYHTAADKIHASVTPDGPCQRQGELEYYTMRDLGAFATVRETFNTRAAGRPDAGALAKRVAAGPITLAPPPSPQWEDIRRWLAAAGIQAEMQDEKITFRFAPPEEDALQLAQPVPHPWLPEREISAVGLLPDVPGSAGVAEANTRLARMIAGGTPASLRKRATDELAERLRLYFDNLLSSLDAPVGGFERESRHSQLRMDARVLFSGRAVLAPSIDLRLDQLGLAEEMAWTLFGPLVQRELGSAEEVAARSERATQVLDDIMARSWVLLNRAPTYIPTALIAFHPVRIPNRVIRLHPLACPPTNADYDGDQAAVFLPLTEEGQREAAEVFSVTGHLRRDPSLIRWFTPYREMTWGIALLSLTPAGRDELRELIGEAAMPDGLVTGFALATALGERWNPDRADEMLERLQRVMDKGLQVARQSGASINPFIGRTLPKPPLPEDDAPDAWNLYAEGLLERLAARTDYTDEDFGPQLLSIKSGARGSLRSLLQLVGPRGAVTDVRGCQVPIRHSYPDGLTPEELFATVPGARNGLLQVAFDTYQMAYGAREPAKPKGFTVLARAMRAEHPGLVFAHAAATGEVDPLTEPDSRLFVGLLA